VNRTATDRMARDGLAFVVLGVLACAREVAAPDSPEPDPPDVAPPGFVVSSPVEQAAGVTVAFVSAIPGTVRWGDQVSVKNLASAGREAMAAVREGGFDPVQLPAAAGDTLQFVMTDSLGKPTETIQMVAARLPVRVVRVQPAARRTDVPLNARIEVVFSSPVVLTSAEQGVRLTRDGVVVSGTVSASDPLSLVVMLAPDVPLVPSASYRVEVSRAVEGVNGLPLAESVVVEFQTASESGTNSLPAAAFRARCAGLQCVFDDLSEDPDPGDSIVTRVWELGDGNVVRNLRSTTHTYATSGGSLVSFVVKLTVTDRQGAADSHSQVVAVAPTAVPIQSGTYERVAPHATPGRHTRYVVNDDGTFEFHDETGTGRVVHHGHWTLCSFCSSSPTLFRFDSIAAAHPEWNPEMGDVAAAGLGSALAGSEIGVSYGGRMASEGFEEGVYSMDPLTVPTSPPPAAGQIAFVRDGRVYVAGTHGGVPVPLTTGPDDLDPSWSPDGSRIAFRRAGTSSPGIYVVDADGANLVLRTVTESDPGYRYRPTWSPDGQWVAFACWPSGAESAICRVRSEGPDTTRVLVHAQRGQLYDPAWSPDGTTIAYISDFNAFDFSFDIWTVKSDGTAAKALREFTFPMGYEQYQPAFSPDGSRIAYVECPWAGVFCSSSAVAVMNADGSSSARLVATRGFSSPTWSRDGQVIAFGSGSDIEWVSADGRQRGRIVTNGHSPAWRP
jgi:hypothetical protein